MLVRAESIKRAETQFNKEIYTFFPSLLEGASVRMACCRECVHMLMTWSFFLAEKSSRLEAILCSLPTHNNEIAPSPLDFTQIDLSALGNSLNFLPSRLNSCDIPCSAFAAIYKLQPMYDAPSSSVAMLHKIVRPELDGC